MEFSFNINHCNQYLPGGLENSYLCRSLPRITVLRDDTASLPEDTQSKIF